MASEGKVVSLEELKQHTSKDKLWLLVNGKVYDVTKFIDEHPGGDEVMIAEAGKDATEAFEDVGHSDEARAMMPAMLVGDFGALDELKKGAKQVASATASNFEGAVQSGSNIMYFIPLSLLVAYFAWRFYSSS
ncbi:cytochrome b5 [Gloeophyllum trabeum ATCC 11539]|uniref:Cytochrome b5 n=1 Tax=Gloeophyllum trabeum (strain ATCC 11539 / FP-39264 / Madison 617) TaxID=670483 RepID=S7QIC6_GLOTA|nr:cytochrome b5 [Gloeophyllum trabeum ATCC 11539]EPQ58962.1 cytochrome b5 [Gloeophyllum trabeum ATCC 11539]